MRELAAQTGKGALAGEGLRLRSRGGWVYVVPLSRRAALKVVAEGPDLEIAAELCDFYAGQVAKLDRPNRGQETK
jgi:mannose-1-phosphate guanylyltransferase/phosphomannomutase